MVQDARHFLVTSDHPTPAIVWKYEGSIANIPGIDMKSTTVTHNLGFTPLIMGLWSDNSGFNPAYDISNAYGNPDYSNGFLQLNECGTDTTTVHISGYNSSTSTKTLYFKLFAYAPPDYNGSVPSVGDVTHFVLNSDNNTPKIIKEGYVDLQSNQSTTIAHNLGYTPQAKVWGIDYYGKTSEMDRFYNNTYNRGADVDSTNLTIRAFYTGRYYYHIYGDSI